MNSAMVGCSARRRVPPGTPPRVAIPMILCPSPIHLDQGDPLTVIGHAPSDSWAGCPAPITIRRSESCGFSLSVLGREHDGRAVNPAGRPSMSRWTPQFRTLLRGHGRREPRVPGLARGLNGNENVTTAMARS
jgi:hypothetical protein